MNCIHHSLTILDLPLETLYGIIEKLKTPQEIAKVARISKLFRQISEQLNCSFAYFTKIVQKKEYFALNAYKMDRILQGIDRSSCTLTFSVEEVHEDAKRFDFYLSEKEKSTLYHPYFRALRCSIGCKKPQNIYTFLERLYDDLKLDVGHDLILTEFLYIKNTYQFKKREIKKLRMPMKEFFKSFFDDFKKPEKIKFEIFESALNHYDEDFIKFLEKNKKRKIFLAKMISKENRKEYGRLM